MGSDGCSSARSPRAKHSHRPVDRPRGRTRGRSRWGTTAKGARWERAHAPSDTRRAALTGVAPQAAGDMARVGLMER